MLKSKAVDIDGLGELTVTELSARAYADMLNARKEGATEVEVSGVVSFHCAFKGKHESVDEVLDQYSPSTLMQIMQIVVELSELKPKKSVADPAKNSSIA